eukprot:1154761-Pelagomonas_calceolata.AAC.2
MAPKILGMCERWHDGPRDSLGCVSGGMMHCVCSVCIRAWTHLYPAHISCQSVLHGHRWTQGFKGMHQRPPPTARLSTCKHGRQGRVVTGARQRAPSTPDLSALKQGRRRHAAIVCGVCGALAIINRIKGHLTTCNTKSTGCARPLECMLRGPHELLSIWCGEVRRKPSCSPGRHQRAPKAPYHQPSLIALNTNSRMALNAWMHA